MANENEFLLYTFLMGIYVTFVYDILRILRRVIPHCAFLVSLEDFCFWVYCALKVFLLMYYESNGTLRWFAVLGALMGMLLYRKLVSPCFVKYVSMILRKVFLLLGKLAGILFRPVRLLSARLRAGIVRAARKQAVKLRKKRELGRRGLKKKLTFLLRMVKMNL